ncbi:MAG: hypothetical protein M5R36_27185 [Deltaproteobacteria bacterium]|nr:hypothetical protein [Deltaproteobacteria bacterium]
MTTKARRPPSINTFGVPLHRCAHRPGFHDANADGDLLDAGDNTRYYTGDANHNVTATIDAATGDVVKTACHVSHRHGPPWSTMMLGLIPGSHDMRRPGLYTGYFFDAET